MTTPQPTRRQLHARRRRVVAEIEKITIRIGQLEARRAVKAQKETTQ